MLLRLYPKGFRDQLGDSMEQTFHDLCRERQETGDGVLGFVFWTFADTIAGIVKENMRKENIIMLPILRKYGTVIIAVIAAVVIILSTYLTKNLDSLWIILIVWSVIWFLWELWIHDKRRNSG